MIYILKSDSNRAKKKHHQSYRNTESVYPLKGQQKNKITRTDPYKEADVSTNHNKCKLMLPVLEHTIIPLLQSHPNCSKPNNC